MADRNLGSFEQQSGLSFVMLPLFFAPGSTGAAKATRMGGHVQPSALKRHEIGPLGTHRSSRRHAGHDGLCSHNGKRPLRGGYRRTQLTAQKEAAEENPSFQTRHELKNQTAIVTGGNKGIGEAITLALAAHGADVVIVARDAKSSADLSELIEKKFGTQVRFVNCDLADSEAVERAAKECVSIAPTPVKILVNNAGIALLNPLLELSTEEWDRTMDINLRAPFLFAKHIVPDMIKRGGGGKIVNISSAAGIGALDRHGAYCASKGALNMLTKVMALEWGTHNIQTNSVCPTVILTDMGKMAWSDPKRSEPMLTRIPLHRFGLPHEVGDLVAYLSSDASSLINGQIIAADGGYTAL